MPKTYYTIDILKFVCAILIVFMHTYNNEWETGKWFVGAICNIAVPYFFITSGFFFTKGILRNQIKGEERQYFMKYFKRIVGMYAIWSILTIPIAWMIIERAHGDYSLIMKSAYFIRLIVFTGSIGIYWYILALIYDCVIIYYAHKKKADVLLIITAIAFWIIGCIYNSPYNNGNLLFESIHVIFGSERNFLNVGLLYMTIGYLFAKNEQKIQFNTYWLIIAFIVAIGCRTAEIEYIKTNIFQAIEAILLFLIGINSSFKLRNQTNEVRELSTAIYLEHFPFILLFDFYLKKGTVLDFSATLIFSFIFYWIIKKTLPQKYYKIMYGG